MKKSKWTFRIVIAAAIAVVMGTTMWASQDAIAQMGRGIRVLGALNDDATTQHGIGFIKEHINTIHQTLHELNLTDEQKESLKSLREEAFEEIEPMIEILQGRHADLRAAVTADAPDEAAIRQAAASLGTSIGDMAVELSGTLQDAHAILTDEQMQIVKEKMELRKEKRQHRRDCIHEFIHNMHEHADDAN